MEMHTIQSVLTKFPLFYLFRGLTIWDSGLGPNKRGDLGDWDPKGEIIGKFFGDIMHGSERNLRSRYVFGLIELSVEVLVGMVLNFLNGVGFTSWSKLTGVLGSWPLKASSAILPVCRIWGFAPKVNCLAKDELIYAREVFDVIEGK